MGQTESNTFSIILTHTIQSSSWGVQAPGYWRCSVYHTPALRIGGPVGWAEKLRVRHSEQSFGKVNSTEAIIESIVWEDMRNLAHKMVYLLDKTNKIDNEWFSLVGSCVAFETIINR